MGDMWPIKKEGLTRRMPSTRSLLFMDLIAPKMKTYQSPKLAGVALVGPSANYWWSCYPTKLSKEAMEMIVPQDKRTFQIAHYAPWLLNWWMNQKWFHSLSVMEGNMAIFSKTDLEIVKQLSGAPSLGEEKVTQQGEFESL